MKYKLIKQFPGIQFNVGDIYEFDYYTPEKYPDFFEPIVEKKTYDDLKEDDLAFWIGKGSGAIMEGYFMQGLPRSETFLTRKEAEDEHKRREWAVRKDKFVPENNQKYYHVDADGTFTTTYNYLTTKDSLIINSGLAFRTLEDCQDAIDNHDLIRLFYQIR